MTNTTPERVNILTEASSLITGQRQEDYGTPEVNFQRMADYANIHFAYNLANNIPITPRQTAEYMILLKMARTINSPTRDSYVDIGGYAGIAGELAQIETAKKEASNQTGGTWKRVGPTDIDLSKIAPLSAEGAKG